MRNRLNSEGHDESQYLPHGVPPVNAFRAAKGDIKRIGEEIRARHWMPDLLFDYGHFEKEHVDTCLSFYAILIGARRVLGICDLLNAITDKMAMEASNAEVDSFVEIMRGLPKPEMNMLIWVVDNDRNHRNISLAFHLIGTITHAIEHTQKIIVEISDRKSKMQKSTSL